jgi:hypothetical protein
MLIVAQPVKKLLTSHETRRFIVGFTRALHWTLSWTRWIQSTHWHPFFQRSVWILFSHLHLGLPDVLFSAVLTSIFIHIIFLHAPPIFLLILLSEYYLTKSNRTNYGVLHYTVFSSLYHFLSLWSKYSLQHTALKYHYKSSQQHIFAELISFNPKYCVSFGSLSCLNGLSLSLKEPNIVGPLYCSGNYVYSLLTSLNIRRFSAELICGVCLVLRTNDSNIEQWHPRNANVMTLR